MNRDSFVDKLIERSPAAFLLLTQIARRAKRTETLLSPLKLGEALVGDFKSLGFSRQKYRSAKHNLQAWGLATFRTTNKGTIAKLTNTMVYNINIDNNNHPDNHQITIKATSQQPSNNHQITTNNNVIMKECKNEKKTTSVEDDKKPSSPTVGNKKKKLIPFVVLEDFPSVKMTQSEYDALPHKLKTRNREYWVAEAQKYWHGRKHNLTNVYLAILNWDRREYVKDPGRFAGSHKNKKPQTQRVENSNATSSTANKSRSLQIDGQVKTMQKLWEDLGFEGKELEEKIKKFRQQLYRDNK